MKLIAAIDENWAIGQEGRLLCRISADMKQFRERTAGNVVILGRKTLATFPQGRPLKDRINLVLTKNKDFSIPGAVPCFSVADAIAKAQAYCDREVYVIGGESVYEQFLPFCEEAYLTKIKKRFPSCDAYLKNLDQEAGWKLLRESKEQQEEEICFSFAKYVRLTLPILSARDSCVMKGQFISDSPV